MVKNSSFLLTPPYLFLYPPTKGTFWIQYYGTVPTNSKFTFFKLTPPSMSNGTIRANIKEGMNVGIV